jgi:hypothetical protein
MDTNFKMTLEEYIAAFKEAGFNEIYKEEFVNKYEMPEYLYFYFNYNKCFLLVFDTFNHSGKLNLNTAHIYFNWQFLNHHRNTLPISGSYYNEGKFTIVSGYFDAREQMNYFINDITSIGIFLKPWKYCPFPFLCHWMDHDNIRLNKEDFQILYNKTKERISKFPEEVKKLMGSYNKGK